MDDEHLATPLAAVLPCPATVAAQPEAFWAGLDVWYGRVIAQHATDAALVAKLLERHGLALLQVLHAWLALPPASATLPALSAAIAQQVILYPDQGWAQTLLLAMELLENRRHDAVAACARLLLPQGQVEAVENAGLSARGARLAYALLLYGHAPADLALLVLYERAERFAYSRQRLLAGAAEANEVSDALQALAPGALDEQLVDMALVMFERTTGDRNRSRCVRVLREEGGILVFVQRVLREASIHELDRTLFGDEAELIILKFNTDLTLLEEHSTRGVGSQVGGAIASCLLGRPVQYVVDGPVTAPATVHNLLDSLVRAGASGRLRLVELQLRQAPLEGSPALVLRGQHDRPLDGALAALAACGVRLLDDLEDVRAITLAFGADGDPAQSHLFRLRFDRACDGLLLHYAGAHVARPLRRNFEAYMRDEHGIEVIPTTGQA